jgi:hypothetical protein
VEKPAPKRSKAPAQVVVVAPPPPPPPPRQIETIRAGKRTVEESK